MTRSLIGGEREHTKFEIIFSIIAYSFCSGSMLLVNKLAIHEIPFKGMVVIIQLVATSTFVLVGKASGLLVVDSLEWKFIKPYLIYIVAFTLGVYTNMSALAVSNVETVIVFRSCTPIAVSFLEYLFLGREVPTTRSIIAMLVIALGAASYMFNDSQFAMDGIRAYFWVLVYFFIICFEMTYGKKIVSGVGLKTNSGPVLYTNLLAIPAMSLVVLGGSEIAGFFEFVSAGNVTQRGWGLLFLSCVVGTGISYSGWYCRGMVSAASYTVVGVMNKFLTVLGNILVWDNHATGAGILSLAVCLIGGSFYEQAPMRK